MKKQLHPDEIMIICDKYNIAYTSQISLLLGWLYNEKYLIDSYRDCIDKVTKLESRKLKNWSDHELGITLKKLISENNALSDESIRFYSLLFFGVNNSIQLTGTINRNPNETIQLKLSNDQIMAESSLTLSFESITHQDAQLIEGEFKKLLENKNMDFDFVKYFIYQAFLISCLENSKNLNIFYKHVIDFTELFNVKFNSENDSLDKELGNFILKIYNEYSLFPYDCVNSISQHIYVPFYSREEDKFGNEEFPNCVELTLYSLCNMLLWNPETRMYRDPPIGSKVNRMFSGNKIKKNPDYITSNEWSRIIQDIENSELVDFDTNIIETFHTSYKKLYYKKSNINGFKNPVKNEIKSGLFNMLNFFIEIMGIDKSIKEKYMNVFDSEDSTIVDKTKLSNLLIEIFEIFIPKGSIDSDKIKYERLGFFRNISRFDIFGTFLFPVKLKSVNLEFDLILYIYDSHTEMHLRNYKNYNNKASIDELIQYFDIFKDSKNEKEVVCHFIKSFVNLNYQITMNRKLKKLKKFPLFFDG